MKTILGTGQLGLAVMEALLKKNPTEEIILINRSGSVHINLPPNVKISVADVTDKKEVKAIAMQSEVIYSCTDVPYQQWKTFYPAVANSLAYALERTNVKLVFADNLYSYGNVMGAEMNEQLTHTSKTKKGMIRASVLNRLLRSGDEFNKRVAFVKAADFIGPRIHKGIFGTDFLDRVYSGKAALLFGKIELPHTFTYIHDFADAIVNIGDAKDTFGQLWHVPNATAMSLDKWIHLFELNTGKPIKIKVLPKMAVRITGFFNSLIRELVELAYQFEYPYLVNHSKYVNRFGDHSTSPSVIVKATVQWYQSIKK